MSMVTLFLCLVLIIIQRKLILPREFVTVTGKGYRPSLIDLGKWKYLALAFNLAYLIIGVIFPLVVLLMVSLHRLWEGSLNFHGLTSAILPLSLAKYSTAKNAIWNSLMLGHFWSNSRNDAILWSWCYILIRTKMKGRVVLDFVSSLSIGIPGIIMAMGVLIEPISKLLYTGRSGLWGWPMLQHFLPIGMRNSNALFLAISPELEECSRTCGALTWLSTLKNISIPLMKSQGLVGGWLILFLIFFKEINALYSAIQLWKRSYVCRSLSVA